ncbi:MAG: hypothetical protein QOG90_15 [Actinomycetota bacterium]
MKSEHFEPELPWDSPKFREKKDTPWTAGCRWLASWWREQQGYQPGERNDISESLVGAMLPLDAEAEDNFYSPKVVTALEDRVIYGDDFGVVPTPVLFRSLLETQVLVFNLLGEFVATPDDLLPWVRTIDPDATTVDAIRIEWGPDRYSRFDGFVEYRTRVRNRRHFLALVCTYAENLAASKLTVRDKHIDATEASPFWRDGASRRLNRPQLRALWIATLAAQNLPEFSSGRVVSMACAANTDALLAANFVRAEVVGDSLVSSSLEELVDSVAATHPDWAAWFRTRYLDFTPVLHLLAPDDPRRGGDATAAVASEDLRRLVAVGQKVSGSRAAFKNVLKRLDNGGTDAAQVAALEARAGDLVADLEAFWQALAALDM